jgi:hypothetical protein
MFVGRKDGKTFAKRYGDEAVPLDHLKVFLSENDNLVNSKRVLHYLKTHDVDCQLMPQLDHATFLFRTNWAEKISRIYAL